MEESIKRIVLNQFPELSAGHHLPRMAEVVGVRESPKLGDVCDEFRPRYAVDIQVLDEHGQPDKAFPVLRDVPLPVPTAGHEAGFFSMPEKGCHVEMGFAYGNPNKPIIRSIHPHERSLPAVEVGEQRWQFGPESFQNVDKDGNWTRKTDGKITDESQERLVKALENQEEYTASKVETEANLETIIGGLYKLQAMQAALLASAGRLDLSAVADLNATSLTTQRYRAPKTWIGSQAENLLQLCSEHLQLMIDLCTILATHTHPGVGAPTQSADIANVGTQTGVVKGRLDGIKE
jgi:hypothetical protein